MRYARRKVCIRNICFSGEKHFGAKTQVECGLPTALFCDVISYVTGYGAPMKSDAERMTDLRRRRVAQGLKQITLWVPEDAAAEVRDLVKRHLEKRRRQASLAARDPAPVMLQLVFRFDQKPPFDLRERLKLAGFNYHAERRCWWGDLSPSLADEWESELMKLGAEILAKQRHPG